MHRCIPFDLAEKNKVKVEMIFISNIKCYIKQVEAAYIYIYVYVYVYVYVYMYMFVADIVM